MDFEYCETHDSDASDFEPTYLVRLEFSIRMHEIFIRAFSTFIHMIGEDTLTF